MICTPTEPGHCLYTNRASGYSYLTDYKLGRYNLLAKDHYVLDKTKYISPGSVGVQTMPWLCWCTYHVLALLVYRSCPGSVGVQTMPWLCWCTDHATEPGHGLYTNRARAWSVHQQSQGMICTPTERPGSVGVQTMAMLSFILMIVCGLLE
jgi:hypothetical protein